MGCRSVSFIASVNALTLICVSFGRSPKACSLAFICDMGMSLRPVTSIASIEVRLPHADLAAFTLSMKVWLGII